MALSVIMRLPWIIHAIHALSDPRGRYDGPIAINVDAEASWSFEAHIGHRRVYSGSLKSCFFVFFFFAMQLRI
jgi:hypothetical protein